MRRKVLDSKNPGELVELFNAGFSQKAIAHKLGCSQVSVGRVIAELGLTRPPIKRSNVGAAMGPREPRHSVGAAPEIPPADPSHLEAFHRARRGFHVPKEKEGEYFALLKTGLPIADVCRKLGIKPIKN